MLKQNRRSVVARAIVILALVVAPLFSCVLPARQAFANEIKKPDGLEVLVNGQPYSEYLLA